MTIDGIIIQRIEELLVWGFSDPIPDSTTLTPEQVDMLGQGLLKQSVDESRTNPRSNYRQFPPDNSVPNLGWNTTLWNVYLEPTDSQIIDRDDIIPSVFIYANDGVGSDVKKVLGNTAQRTHYSIDCVLKDGTPDIPLSHQIAGIVQDFRILFNDFTLKQTDLRGGLADSQLDVDDQLARISIKNAGILDWSVDPLRDLRRVPGTIAATAHATAGLATPYKIVSWRIFVDISYPEQLKRNPNYAI